MSKIGIFDSGFGGLTIFKEIYKTLPEYKYIYLGDSARVPYGGHSDAVIYKYTKQAVNFLFKQGCELIILACGTVSATALRKIQQEYLPKNYPDKKVLGVVIPLSEEAISVSRFSRIGVVGTSSTIASGSYARELKKEFNKNKIQIKNQKSKVELEVFVQACRLLVPLIEEGWAKKPETKMILKKYLRSLKQKKIDTLILGCTHYPLLMKQFKQVMGKNCNVLDSGKIVTKSLQDYLSHHYEIETKLQKNKSNKNIFYTTGDSVRFDELGNRFFSENIKSEKIEL